MSASSSFLWRFLDDVWDLLPTEDRGLFESYWRAQVRAAANLQQKAIEASLSQFVSDVPVFLTERWSRFTMDDETCDLFKKTDKITMSGTSAYPLSKETALYETLSLSNSSGQIQYAESVQFFDNKPRRLRYGGIVKGTVAVKIGSFEYTINRDYVVNHETGTIRATEDGRLPVDKLATIEYQHKAYARGIDYEVDEVRGTVARTSESEIPGGFEVHVSYTYNGTATLPLQGTKGAVDGTVLTDEEKDFSALLPGRTVTIDEGENKGTYAVSAVLGAHKIQVSQNFPAKQESNVVYSIDAFPHGVKVEKALVSIPTLQERLSGPEVLLEEGVDYIVSEGVLALRRAFPLSKLGPEDRRQRVLWAETVKVDRETPYRNFGVLIDFYRENSEAYKQALQGLWYAFWTGSTPGNIRRGIHILLGLPFAKRAGTVTKVDESAAVIDVTDSRGQIISYTIPSGLTATVEVGDEVDRFAALTDGVQIFDRNNEPGFVKTRLGRSGIARFLTTGATRGRGNTDETKALELLENHLYIPQVLVEAISESVNVQELVRFLDNMKPAWSEYVFSFAVEESEGIEFEDEDAEVELSIDLTSTVSNNDLNKSFLQESFIAEGSVGEVIAGGTQAAGNFEDGTKDFNALGVEVGDVFYIQNTDFLGGYEVLKIIDSNTLSLSISDSDVTPTSNIEYVVTPGERRMDDDSVLFSGEYTLLEGTEYLAPSSLNTKTDIVFRDYDLVDEEIKALLLVDINISGSEVQGITDADAESQEISVPSAPSPGTQDHEIASAALKRTDNGLSSVTHAYAI